MRRLFYTWLNLIHLIVLFIAPYLVPDVFIAGHTGACGHHPAVSHLTLVQVMRTDAVLEKARVLGNILSRSNNTSLFIHASNSDLRVLQMEVLIKCLFMKQNE